MNITSKRLTLESLRDVDGGRIEVAFNELLRQVIADCDNRPGLAKGRKVKLEVTVAPVTCERGRLSQVAVTFDLNNTVPKRESAPYTMRFEGGDLTFQEIAPEDPDQQTIQIGGGAAAPVRLAAGQ